ncbi:MAG: PAS domain S-box protein [Vicinamibacterales bacterium]
MNSLPTSPSHSTLTNYAAAAAAVLLAVLARWLVTPWIGAAFPLATIFPAIVFSVWFGGSGPAIFTSVAGFVACDVVFIPGVGVLGGGVTFNELVGILVYLASCSSIIVLGEAMRTAQRRLEVGQRELTNTNLLLENRIEAQSLLAAIVASSDDAIVSKTLDGTITSWNQGAQKLFGYTPDEAIGRSILILIPDDRRDEEHAIIERIRRGERVDHLEVKRQTKDGRLVDVSLTVSPVHDRDGRVIGASKTARDITTRRMVEDSLRRNEEAQRLLVAIHDATRGLQDPALVMREVATRVGLHLEATRCAYGEVNVDQDQITISRGFTDGVPTVAGRYHLEMFGPAMAAELKRGRTVVIPDVRIDPLTDDPVAQAAYDGMQIVSMICVPLFRSGSLVAVLVVCDGKPRRWLDDEASLVEQVAQRTLFAVDGARAAESLRENRDVLALAMGAGKMGAWSRDLELDTAWWSPELAEILGLPPGGPNEREAVAALMHPEDISALQAGMREALAQRTDFVAEFRFRHAQSGEWRWMEMRAKAGYNADGQATMFYGLGIDITERRQTVEALQEADRRKDEFLATLAHELRNPLAPISSGLHILRYAGADSPAAARAREIMERQIGQMVRLVDDLLDVARITTGKVELRPETMDLTRAVRDAVEISRPLIGLGGQPFSVVLPPAPVYVHGDRTRLAQVFANLLNNSAKYSERGQQIAISVEQIGTEAVVSVRDAGVGIDTDTLPRVFDMFRQGEGANQRMHGGLGIGLFIVKRIVEMHAGTVEAHSDGPGQGSEFVIRIPLADGAVAAHSANGHSATPDTVPRRILVVDDNEDAAEALAAMLAIDGHETQLAYNGPQAFRTAEAFKPDVVFLDIGMPTLDGHETARRIRQEPWGKEIVLIALTGWGQPEDRTRSKEAGFNHHLVKPADPEMVAKLLSSLPA